jgi:hypothetical protein
MAGQVLAEPGEPLGPELAIVRQPRIGLLERPRDQPAAALAPALVVLDQAGVLERPQVLEDRRQREPGRRRELAERADPAIAKARSRGLRAAPLDAASVQNWYPIGTHPA